MGTLAGKTYEVQVDQGDGRWVVVDIHETRNVSIEQARAFLESGKYVAVQVVSEDNRKGMEIIYENTNASFIGKPITIVPIDTAPFCTMYRDYFSLDFRKALGRVLHNYLEHHTISALELMFDASMIRMLENSDTLFPQAIQQIAGAQTRGTDAKPADQVDELYKVVSKLRKEATEVSSDITGYEIIKEKGINALISRMNSSYGADDAYYYILQGFARYLRDGGDWNAKLELLSKLGSDDLKPEAVIQLDEVLAEILYSAPAIQELLGGQPDLASAIRVIIMLTQGRAKAPPNALSCIEPINDILFRLDLPKTRQVLLDRAAAHLGGIKKLTKEKDRESERNALKTIIREATDMSGILGGDTICGAITQRARLSFSQDGEDLTFPDAMARVINLLPHRAARIGYLAELSTSPIASDYTSLVMSEFSKTINQLTSMSALLPANSNADTRNDVIKGLKARLTSENIPPEYLETLSKTFDTLLSKHDPVSKTETPISTATITDKEFKTMLNEKPKHQEVPKGEILFEEGETGKEAYLIVDGKVEVFQRVGNTEHVIATLKKGEIIGEMSLIDNQPRMASARILDDTKLLVISQESLKVRLERLRQEDRFMRRLMDTLVSRLRGEAQAGA